MAYTERIKGAQMQAGDRVRSNWIVWMNDQSGVFGISWYVLTNVGGALYAGDFATYLGNAVEGDLQAALPSAAALGVLRVNFLGTPPTKAGGMAESAANGSNVSGIQGQQVSGIITWYTDLGGPQYRGRSYVPFPSLDTVDVDGLPTVTYNTQLATLAASIFSITTVGVGGATITIKPIIYHRATNTDATITDYRVRGLFATQKRRGNYGRLNSST